MADTPKPPTDRVEGRWHEASRDEGADEGSVDSPSDPGRRPAASAPVVRIGGSDRGPLVLVVVLAMFVAVALVKPWPGGGAPAPALPPGSLPPTAPPTVDPLAAIRLDCQDPPGWRIFSRERWAGGVLRSWRTLEPVHAAAGPLDPVIPALPIGPGIVALGYCAIWSGPDRPPDDAAVRAWSLSRPTGGAATPLELLSASTTLRPPLGALYAPPAMPASPAMLASPAAPGSPAVVATWPAGTYVFEVAAGTFQRWWAITILEDTGPPRPSPTP